MVTTRRNTWVFRNRIGDIRGRVTDRKSPNVAQARKPSPVIPPRRRSAEVKRGPATLEDSNRRLF